MISDIPGKKFIRRILRGIRRRLDFSTEGRRQRVIKNPPEVNPMSIVFTSWFDYTGNPKALFLYMIDHGYNEKYKITWLFNRPENFFEFDIPNVRSVNIKNSKGERTPEAQTALMSAKYVFYSHNVNWCKNYRSEQIFIDLWHGCGYKGGHESDKRIYYDYLIVTSERYKEIVRGTMKYKDGTYLDLGYPRNEFLFSDKTGAVGILREFEENAGADKAVIWLPTFRKSTLRRLDCDTGIGETGLPILYDASLVQRINDLCRECNVLLIIKQHFMQTDYEINTNDFTNVIFLNERFLMERGADFYEMMGTSDAMITDYSSAAVDYMLVDKPLGFTLDDFDDYEKIRGWSFDNVKDYMPGHHIYNFEDMEMFIRDIAGSKDPYKEWREKVTSEVHTYRDGFSERILRYFDL